MQQERLNEMLALCGVGARYWESTLNTPKLKGSKHGAVLKSYVGKLREQLSQGIGLFIFGDYGHGKTSLAVCVMIEALELDANPYLVRASRLPEIIIARPWVPYLTSGEGLTQELKVLRECDLLVIDNLNEELKGEWKSTALEDLIRDRYEEKLTTIVTSNLQPGDLKCVISQGSASLLADTTIPVEVKGTPWRVKQESRA